MIGKRGPGTIRDGRKMVDGLGGGGVRGQISVCGCKATGHGLSVG